MVANHSSQKRIACFGAGGGGKAFLSHSGITPYTFFDNDTSKHGSTLLGIPVSSPQLLTKEIVESIDEIYITSGYVKSIHPQLLSLGFVSRQIKIPPKSWLGNHPFTSQSVCKLSAKFLSDFMSMSPSAHIVCAGGTALGLVREGNFIRWDFDFDLFAARSSFQSVMSFLLKEGCNPYIEHSSIKAEFRPSEDVVIPFSVDFFDETQEYYIDRYEDHQWTWPTTMFTKSKIIYIFNYPIHVPNPPEKYLSWIYGSDWMTPRPEFSYDDYCGT